GPCAFLDAHDPSQVFSSIDRHGRYAYGQQPAIAQWNIARAVETVLPLLDPDPDRALAAGNARLAAFRARYARHWLAVLRRRLGLTGEAPGDEALADAFLAGLAAEGVDHHLAWLDLLRIARDQAPRVLIDGGWPAWIRAWQERRAADRVASDALLAAAIPRVVPRNHRVEEALAGAVNGDWAPWDRLLAAVRRPFADDPGHEDLMAPPPPEIAACHRTFCGT
ncbi:MAG: hypothetical protein RLZZ127_1287, partial [Planctomycetota bacterium]